MDKNSEHEKMPKSLKGLGLSDKSMSDLNKLKWVVTEKIHGANFSFVYEDQKLKYAKRKDYLSWTDDFFGFQEVVHNIENKILSLFEKLCTEITADKYIIYGELFGGKYPHPDVIPNPNIQAIQTGVYYSPDIQFTSFDIATETHGIKSYLDYDRAVNYFEMFEILYVKPIFIGKLNEALLFNTRIKSTIPGQLNLPELTENLIEGIVIKPLSHSELELLESRPIVKIKNPEFDEEKKFHEAEKWTYIPDVSSNTEDLSFIIDEICIYINDNRLDSVISKTGGINYENPERMKEIYDEFHRDIIFDFNEQNGQLISDLSKSQQSWIHVRVRSMIHAYMTKLQKNYSL